MGSDFGKIVSAETFKLRRQKSSYVTAILVVVLAVFLFLVLEYTTSRNWVGIPSGYFVASSVISWMNNVMLLFTVIITSFLISQEFALGTVKATWVRPVTRSQWYAAKVCTAAGRVTVLFVAVAVVTVILALIRMGLTDLTEKNFVVHSAGSLTARLSLTVALNLWAIWAATAFAALVASLFNNSGGAIATTIGAGIVMLVLGALPPIRPFLLTTLVASPMEQMVAMSKGLPLPFEWSGLVWRTVIGGGTWMALSYILGQRIIQRKEITN